MNIAGSFVLDLTWSGLDGVLTQLYDANRADKVHMVDIADLTATVKAYNTLFTRGAKTINPVFLMLRDIDVSLSEKLEFFREQFVTKIDSYEFDAVRKEYAHTKYDEFSEFVFQTHKLTKQVEKNIVSLPTTQSFLDILSDMGTVSRYLSVDGGVGDRDQSLVSLAVYNSALRRESTYIGSNNFQLHSMLHTYVTSREDSHFIESLRDYPIMIESYEGKGLCTRSDTLTNLQKDLSDR